jgi:hypothetical protein
VGAYHAVQAYPVERGALVVPLARTATNVTLSGT